MFNDRFGSFSYQIKHTKFYQFLELTWRIVLLSSGVGELPKETQPETQINPNQKESQNYQREISY